MSFVFYRFISTLDQMQAGGQLVTNSLEIDFWRKRFIYMEWISGMDNYQLELILIGCNPPTRPFYNDYTPEGLRKIAAVNKLWAIRYRWLPTRTLLVEEVYNSLTDLEERTRDPWPKILA